MGLIVTSMVVAALLSIAYAFIETREREPTRQSWTGGRTSADWPSRCVALLSGVAFSVGVFPLANRIGWGLAAMCLVIFLPSIVLGFYLDRRKRDRLAN